MILPTTWVLVECDAIGSPAAAVVVLGRCRAETLEEARRFFAPHLARHPSHFVQSEASFHLGLPKPLAHDRCRGCGMRPRAPRSDMCTGCGNVRAFDYRQRMKARTWEDDADVPMAARRRGGR